MVHHNFWQYLRCQSKVICSKFNVGKQIASPTVWREREREREEREVGREVGTEGGREREGETGEIGKFQKIKGERERERERERDVGKQIA